MRFHGLRKGLRKQAGLQMGGKLGKKVAHKQMGMMPGKKKPFGGRGAHGGRSISISGFKRLKRASGMNIAESHGFLPTRDHGR